jgi:hypothetical protein
MWDSCLNREQIILDTMHELAVYELDDIDHSVIVNYIVEDKNKGKSYYTRVAPAKNFYKSLETT